MRYLIENRPGNNCATCGKWHMYWTHGKTGGDKCHVPIAVPKHWAENYKATSRNCVGIRRRLDFEVFWTETYPPRRWYISGKIWEFFQAIGINVPYFGADGKIHKTT